MNVKRILFPTDFSDHNDAARAYASSLAAEADALLYIVHVDERPDVNTVLGELGYVYPEQWETQYRRQVRDQLFNVLPTIPAVRHEHRYLTGSPLREILEFAEHQHVDLIVMASHGRTGFSRLLMGSIAEGVMRGAPCPVLVVKQPDAALQPVGKMESQSQNCWD